MRHAHAARAALAFALAAAAAGTAVAHHGWGSYDAKTTLTLTGAVAQLDWTNPHVHVFVPHEGRRWEAVLAPPFRMSARGLTPDMIAQGVEVSVIGYPSTKVPTEMRAERIVIGGKTFELR